MTEQLVRKALQAFADTENKDELDVIEVLLGDGVNRVTSEKLAALVPLAFGRVLISHIGKVEMSTEYDLELLDGQKITRSLNSEPIFLEALKMGVEMFHSGPRVLFEPASTFSAEFNSVNAALNSGTDINGATIDNPVFFGYDGARWIDDAS